MTLIFFLHVVKKFTKFHSHSNLLEILNCKINLKRLKKINRSCHKLNLEYKKQKKNIQKAKNLKS